MPGGSVSLWLEALVVTWTLDGDLSATGLFLDSSTPATARGAEVRDVAARWARVLEDAEEEKATFFGVGADVALGLATQALPAADRGQGFVNEVAGRLGPRVLAQLRADDAFVALVLQKGSRGLRGPGATMSAVETQRR